MSQFRILVASPFPTQTLQWLQSRALVTYAPDITQTSLEEYLSSFDGLILGSSHYINEEVLEQASNLRVVALVGSEHREQTGQLWKATIPGLKVISVPNTYATAIAEQTVMLMLQIAQPTKVLQGGTLGIVGFGAIGLALARLARAFGLRVLVNQPRLTPQLALQQGVESRDLRDLMVEADFISVHVPGNPNTADLLNKSMLQHLQKGAFLVNTSHFAVADWQTIISLLLSHHLAGVAAAVSESEKKQLLKLCDGSFPPNLVLTERLPSDSPLQAQSTQSLAELLLETLEQVCGKNPLSLEIVPMVKVFPHERYDEKRVHLLAQRIQESDVFTNPPIVSKKNDKYIVLDGATRSTACRALGFQDIVVQVVDANDPGLRLDTWQHAVRQISSARLINRLLQVDEIVLTPSELKDARTSLANGGCIAALVCDDGQAFQVTPNENINSFAALNRLVEVYTGLGLVARTVHTEIEPLMLELPDSAMLVLFRPFTIHDVLEAGSNHQLFPAGITRFVVPGRVLRVNVPKSILLNEHSVLRKNAWLNEFMQERMSARNPRYYQEPIILLDE